MKKPSKLRKSGTLQKLSRLLTFWKCATFSRFWGFFYTKTDQVVTRSLSLKGFSNRTRNSWVTSKLKFLRWDFKCDHVNSWRGHIQYSHVKGYWMWPRQQLTWSHSLLQESISRVTKVTMSRGDLIWVEQIKIFKMRLYLLITQPSFVRFENLLKLKLLVTHWSVF